MSSRPRQARETGIGGADVNWRDKALLRPRELAEASGRSLRTIQRKLSAGEIESRLEDGCRVIPIRAALKPVAEDSCAGADSYEREPSAEQKADEIVEHFRRRHG
jgi:hypothetical protein